MNKYNEYGLKVPEILLPKDKDLKSWSVIACDQYTQSPEYWNKVKQCVNGKPSTLNIIYPEVYLGEKDRKARIDGIKATMKDYLEKGVFDEAQEELIYIERKTEYGRIRKGLIAALDLECYEWKPMSKALVRATEATIVERIPPRKEIRNEAPIELPHIMLLVNDPSSSLIEKTGSLAKKNHPLYDGDLMLDSGHITGWAVKDGECLDNVEKALKALKEANTSSDGSCFLFAVGDGNHSLATAKAVWDEYKEKTGLKDSPVRYALVEIVNIYDAGLTFEPIHRVMFAKNRQELFDYIKKSLENDYNCVEKSYDLSSEMEENVRKSKGNIGFAFQDKNGMVSYKALETDIKDLAVSVIQPILDRYIKEHDCKIDYIHGSDELFRLCDKDDSFCIMLPPVDKESFFGTISSRGPLPRKSFSMGEASEKRFYLECRKLFS